MITSIAYHVDPERCGGPLVAAQYAVFLEEYLAVLSPEAQITIATARQGTDVLPLVVEATTWQEREDVQQELTISWQRFCAVLDED